ncbi:MAG: hypothetical protein KGD64_01705 [Candidatus Heimdallarchaeota archaeon]|nr:hypothetical protein [Candidatus Heimdallarchaeota archaeon]
MAVNAFDILFVITAILANLCVSAIYVSDRHNSMNFIRKFGITFLSLGLPMIAVLIGYTITGYDWWIYVLLSYTIVFFIVQLLLDYILKIQFRENTVQHVVYIIFFYIFQAGMIIIAFNINDTCGYAVSISFWILLAALIYLLIGKGKNRNLQNKTL